jgi:hypothetical protein
LSTSPPSAPNNSDGALPRLERLGSPHKLERVAMEEVRQGVIHYTLPTVEDVARGRSNRE